MALYKTSEILQDDNLDALIAKLKQLEGVVDNLTKARDKLADSSVELEENTKKLNATTANGRDEIVKNAKAADGVEKAYQTYQKAISDTNKEIQHYRSEANLANQIKKNEAKLAANVAGSYNALSAQYSIIKIRLNAMSKAEREATKEGQALVKRSKEIHDEMKRLQEVTGNTTLNVGNYTSALADLPGVLGAAGKGVQGLGSQLKALLANPVVLFVGLITGALITLFNAFKKSENGSRLLAKGAALVGASFRVLIEIADRVAIAITNFLEDPLAGIKKFGNAIKENIINRLEGVVLAVGFAGKAIGKLLTGNFDEAKKAAEGFNSALVQVGTGMDALQQKGFIDGIKDVINVVDKATEASLAYVDAQRAIAKQNRVLETQLSKLETAYELAQQRADDDTLSLRQQAEASTDAQAAAEALAATRIKLAKNNLALINSELAAKKGDFEAEEQLRDQQAQAIKAVEEAQRGLVIATRKAEIQRRKILRDAFKQELDFAIDLYDARKRLLERQIKDEAFSFDERLRMYEKITELDRSAFAEQIKLVEDFTGKRVDLNALALIEDEKIVRERLKQYELDEITTNRILEILKERAAATQDIFEIERALVKERETAADAEAKRLKTLRQKQLSETLNAFDQVQALRKAEFETIKRTEKKKADFQIEQEKARIRKILELNEEFGNLTLAQVKTLEAELNKFFEQKKELKSIYDLLGIDVSDEGKAAIKSTFDFVKQQLTDFMSFRTKIADRNVANADREVQAAQAALDNQITLQAEGLANTVDARQKDLADAKERQDQALKQQERVAKQERLIQQAQTATNMVLALSKLFATNPILAIGLGAVVLGAFAGFQIAASKAAKKTFGEGDFQILEGGSHASGNDIPLGTRSKDGRAEYAEGGEARMILPKRVTAKYRSLLPEIYHALKGGTFENEFARQANAARDLPLVISVGGNQMNTRGIETGIGRLIDQGMDSTYKDGKGRLVVKRGNRTTTYVN